VLKIFHTADWHLGHRLHGLSRRFEHEAFLDWLLDRLQEARADALIVAGDIFDSTNPSAAVLSRFYRFLLQARQRMPALTMILVGGNHDSAARLEAPNPLLQALDVQLIGAITRNAAGVLESERLIVPLRSQTGEVEAWCGAMPFLRNGDLPLITEQDDPLIAGVRACYDALFSELRQCCQEGQAMIATGHCYMVNGRVSELSERRILGGNQHALPADIFPDDIAYAALGHLHLAQAVDPAGRIRYSGSPIPLSLAEADYPHQVLQLEIEGGQLRQVTGLPVPRSVEIIRIPADAPAPLETVSQQLDAFAPDPELPLERQPLLEVRVQLERPEPDLRQQIESRCAGKAVRLLRVSSHYSGQGVGLADMTPGQQLDELQPEQVFLRCYQQQYEQEPDDRLLACFHELLEQTRAG